MGCCYGVPEDKVFIIERLGKFDKLSTPGFLCLPVPCLCSKAGEISTRIQQLIVRCETKTKDNVFVTVIVAVQFEVLRDKIYEAFYKLSSPTGQINSFVFDCVRSCVPALNLDDLFEEKEKIASQVKDQLDHLMSEFGFRIVNTLITDIEPDPKVKSAMNDINANRRLRIAAQEKAEADKILLVKRAEADAESKFLQGEGVARQRKAIVDGLKESVNDFSTKVEGMGSKQVLEMVIMTQYFDSLKEIGGTSQAGTTLFLNHNPGSLKKLAAEMRGGILSSG